MKFSEKEIKVLNTLEFKEPKTKEGVKFLQKWNLDSALIVDTYENRNLFLSLRNIPKVTVVDPSQVNVYDVLRHRSIVFSKKAFEELMERLK